MKNHYLYTSCRLAVILAFLYATSNIATAEEVTINLLPHWKVGEKVKYKATKSRSKSRNSQKVLDTKNNAFLTIEVIKASTDGYLLNCVFDNATLEDPSQAANPLVQKISNFTNGQKILVEMDTNGTITGVQNWKQLQKNFSDMLDEIISELKKSGMNESMLQQIRSQIEGIFSSQKQVEQMCTKNLAILFLTLGRTYTKGEPIQYQDMLPNPLGGSPLTTHASFEFESIDKKTNQTTIQWKQKVDSAKAQKAMMETLKKMAQRMGKPGPPENAIGLVSIEDNATIISNLSTGWPIKVNQVRDVKVTDGLNAKPNNTQKDSISFMRVNDND